MNLDERMEKNIQRILETRFTADPFGVSAVQRLLKVGYNEACHTLERGCEQGKFKVSGDKPFQYVVVR